MTIKTDAGDIAVSESIEGYEALKALAFEAWKANVGPD